MGTKHFVVNTVVSSVVVSWAAPHAHAPPLPSLFWAPFARGGAAQSVGDSGKSCMLPTQPSRRLSGGPSSGYDYRLFYSFHADTFQVIVITSAGLVSAATEDRRLE